MTKLWNRAFDLTVSTLHLQGFRCKFKIEKTLKPEPNKALIEIYNLSEEHRLMLGDLAPGKAIKLGKKKTKVAKPVAGKVPVRLLAGYEDPGADLIYLGDLRTVDSEIDGSGNWVTSISSGDGERAYRTTRINQAFGPKTPAATALRAAVKALGLGGGNIEQVINRLKLQGSASLLARGIVMSGSAAQALTDLCRSADIEWSIQDETVQFVDFGKVLSERAALISPGTGMVGSPNVSADGVMNCKTLIIPGLRCGGVVVLESALLEGNFRIEKMAYTGDTHSTTDWCAEIWAKRY